MRDPQPMHFFLPGYALPLRVATPVPDGARTGYCLRGEGADHLRSSSTASTPIP